MMNGSEAYEAKLNAKIDRLLNKNADKKYLVGFRYSLDDMSLSSIYDYLCRANQFMDFSGKQPEDLDVDDYNIYLGTLKKNGRTSSYRILTYSALKRFSQYLKAKRINESNPMAEVRRPKAKESIKTTQKREKGFLEIDEIAELKTNIKTMHSNKYSVPHESSIKIRDMAIIMVFLSTGIRCNALCKLDTTDINAENHSIKVIDKGEKIRDYILSESVWAILNNWLKEREKFYNGNPAIFIKTDGDRISYYGIYDMIKKYSKTITGKNITPHKLRATYGTQLYNATGDIHFVQRCMNHYSPQTTALYIRGQGNRTEEASNIMESIIC